MQVLKFEDTIISKKEPNPYRAESNFKFVDNYVIFMKFMWENCGKITRKNIAKDTKIY